MRSLLVFLGTIALIVVLTASGAIQGNACLSHVGCIQAQNDSLVIKGNSP